MWYGVELSQVNKAVIVLDQTVRQQIVEMMVMDLVYHQEVLVNLQLRPK